MLRLRCRDKTERQAPPYPAVNKITQTIRFRQAVIEYSLQNGVTKQPYAAAPTAGIAAARRKRRDGTLPSLTARSHRRTTIPADTGRKRLGASTMNPNTGLAVFWAKLRQRGYARPISGLYRLLRKRGQRPRSCRIPSIIPSPMRR